MRVLLVAVFVVGCSASVEESYPAPIAHEFQPVNGPQVTVTANGGSERIVDGMFTTGRKPGTFCEVKELVAGCAIESCTRLESADADGTVVDPGAVTISSPSLGKSVPLVPNTTGYARVVQPGDFGLGEVVHVSATGSASLPAFELDVRVPGIAAPKSFGNCGVAASQTAPGICHLTDAPVAKWSGGDKVVLVTVAPIGLRSSYEKLVCAFDGSLGAGRIPDEALARLNPADPYGVGITSEQGSAQSGQTTAIAYRILYGGRLDTVVLSK